MKPIRLLRGFFTVGSWTMLSRILGFVRDAWIAAALGTGPVAQAFIVAFSLPNMFRRFFAEGAFNTAFVPMFSKKLEAGDNAEGFAREAMGGLALLLIALSALAQIFMPLLVFGMASGFSGDERFDLAVSYSRITFPYIIFISLAALASGVLNAKGRFSVAAAAPVVLNVFFLGALWLTPLAGWDAGYALACIVPFAGAAQFAMVWYACRKAGISLIPKIPRLSPDMKKMVRVAIPAMLAGGVVQVNLIIGRQIASYHDQAIAWLYNADRLYQLPLGVVAIAIGVVLLPDLSRRLEAGDVNGSRASFNRATEFALILTLPSAVALFVMAVPLVDVLFQRGKFGVFDTAGTALAVAVYGLGLPAFVLQKTLQPLFFARNDTARPFYYATVSMFLNVSLAIFLANQIGYIGVAIATSLSAWVMVGQLWHGSRDMGAAVQLDERLIRRAPRILLAALLMGTALYFSIMWLGPLLDTRLLRFFGLFTLIVIGFVSYFISGIALGAFKLSDLRAIVKPSSSSKAAKIVQDKPSKSDGE